MNWLALLWIFMSAPVLPVNSGLPVAIDESLVYFEESNWKVDFDAYQDVTDYFAAGWFFLRNNQVPVRPYFVNESGKRISLREWRPLTGGGYVWDIRAGFRVFVHNDGSFSTNWIPRGSCFELKSQQQYRQKISYDQLSLEIAKFYRTNSRIYFPTKIQSPDGNFYDDPTLTELEIVITSDNGMIKNCPKAIEAAALGYQLFRSVEKDSPHPFSVRINCRSGRNDCFSEMKRKHKELIEGQY